MNAPEHEDGPPNAAPRSYPADASTIRPPEPGPEESLRPTLHIPKAQLDALNAAIAEGHKASTAEIVGALDRAVLALMRRADETDKRIDHLRDDVRTWLFGDGEGRTGIAQDLGTAREGVASALAAINNLPPRLKAIEDQLETVAEASEKSLNVACGSWMQVTTGKVDDQRRETINAIVISHSVGGG